MNYADVVLVLKSIADDTRLRIIELLSRGELCASQLLESFQISQPTLSYHMKILCDSGVVDGRRSGQLVYYTLKKETFLLLRDYLHTIMSVPPEFEHHPQL